MELNRNDRRGEYKLPYDDRQEQSSGKIFCSKRKVICLAATFVVLLITSAVLGTVFSLNDNSDNSKAGANHVSNRSRKTAGGDKIDGHQGQPWKKPRLPRDLIPQQYWITQRINMTDSIYHGQVRIKILAMADTQIVMLHADPMMKYTYIELRSAKTIKLELQSTHYRNKYLVIVVKEALQRGQLYFLAIRYIAPFTTHPRRGQYKAYQRRVYDFKTRKWIQQRSMAVTMFFPVYARKSFPCFDEPDMKARFSLTLMYQPGYTALSNMPLRGRHMTKSLIIDSFEVSFKMPTYLLNYVVFDYTPSKTTTANKTVIKVWSPARTSNSRELALQAANVTLPFYEVLFKIGYPLPKLDMVTAPDYNYAAMEYWGLITYQQKRLLFSETRPSTNLLKRQSIVLLITHELVHQWFGNLVTLKWWDDILIHEGVATYFQYFGAAKCLPQFNIMEQFYNIEVRQAMEADALESSKCVTQSVTYANEADRNVVPLVYQKGAAIFRMLHAYIGNVPFMAGFRLFLKRYAYGNADRFDLWSCISETSNIEVSSLFNTWTSQPGFPIITASEVKNGKVFISQRRFLTAKNSPVQSGSQKWHIPITYITSIDPKRTQYFLLTSENATMDIQGDWFKLNVEASGYYVVNYDVKNWKRIAKQLVDDHRAFTILDRSSIIKDVFTMAEEGLLPFPVALDVTKYLDKEKDWIPWQYAKHAFSEMIVKLPERSSLRLKLIQYFKSLSKPVLDEVGWKERATLGEQMLQETAISAALNANDKKAIEINDRIFKSWVHNKTYIPDNIAKVVYFYGILNGNNEDWQIVYQRYGYEWRDDERAKLLNALTASRDPVVLSKLLRVARLSRFVHFGDVIRAVADSSRLGRSVAWTFVKGNWGNFHYTRIPNYAINMYISPVADKFSSSFRLHDVYEFLKRKFPGRKLPLEADILLRKIKRNVEWMKKETGNMELWLDHYSSHK